MRRNIDVFVTDQDWAPCSHCGRVITLPPPDRYDADRIHTDGW
jgi:hypothetical protein